MTQTKPHAPDSIARYEAKLLDACLEAAGNAYCEGSGEDEAAFAIAALVRTAEVIGPADPEALGKLLICVGFKVRYATNERVGSAEDRREVERELAEQTARLLKAVRGRREA